ncbi:MAG: adenylate/guanylate cyclase domain-containing protein [Roseibacillus sp.]
MSEKGIRRASAIFGIVLTLVAGWLGLSRVGPFVSLSYDLPFAIHRAAPSPDVCLVYVTDHQDGTLSREIQPDLLEALNRAGAKAVAYDIVFEQEVPHVDPEFAMAIRKFRGVDEEGEGVDGARQREVFLAFSQVSSSGDGFDASILTRPNNELYEAVGHHSPVVVSYQDDKYVARRITTEFGDWPTLCWSVASSFRRELSNEEPKLGLWLNYPGPSRSLGSENAGVKIPWYPADAVVSGGVKPAAFKDKIVFVGGALEGVDEALGRDQFMTPYHRISKRSPYMSGVELQALMTSNLLAGNGLKKSSRKEESWVLVGFGILVALLMVRLRPAYGVVASVVLCALVFGVGVATMSFGGFWVPWAVLALVQVPTALLWGTGSHFYIERLFRARLEEEKRVMREAFQRYVSPPMLDQLTESGFSTPLGGEKREVAVMFTDIADFTKNCERVGDPEKVVASLNEYFERTTKEIFDCDGVVIKFIGDAIVAGWGAPVDDPAAARNAAKAAWGLFENSELEMEGVKLKTRVGIHFGEVLAGNIGSSQHIDYTYIGDAVNLAARLESLNKQLGTNILLSEEVASQLGDEFVLRRVGNFQVKGRSEPTGVYELLGLVSSEKQEEWIEAYERGLESFEEGDLEAALDSFKAVEGLRSFSDGPSQLLVKTIEQGTTNGIIVMTEK